MHHILFIKAKGFDSNFQSKFPLTSLADLSVHSHIDSCKYGIMSSR